MPNKYTAIDLFAGGGGTALGLELAGFDHVAVNEKAKDPAATLRLNRPDWNVIEGDITKVSFTEYKDKVDLVEGGFPCQAFSYAGKRAGLDDVRGTMFYEFARTVKEVNPKLAMGENVKGLLTHNKGDTFASMLSVMEDLGYRTYWKVMDSSLYNVPQKRERLILICVREDLEGDFVFPEPNKKAMTLREAIADRPVAEGHSYSVAKKAILDLVPEGGNWKSLPADIQTAYLGGATRGKGGMTGFAKRLSWDEPAPTLMCSPMQKSTERCHPDETRPLNIKEYARVQSFPDDWDFSGGLTAQYKQIGNAVPVNLSRHIGKSLIDFLEKKQKCR